LTIERLKKMKLSGNYKIIFFTSMLITCLASCENDIAEINSVTSAIELALPLESGKNVEMLYSDSAIVRAKLTAPQLDRYMGKKNYMEMPKGMLVIFFDENKKEQNRLSADYGIGYDNGAGMDKMEAKRHVVVINEKGDKLETEHLVWNAATKEIFTDEFVKITTKEEVIWGEGLKANQDFSKYEITHPQGVIQVDDKEFNGENKEEKK
jgi:LPS export ABC transporter protein LptC